MGFSIAAPVGPIGVLCIRRTLTQGKAVGFVSGLGAASADAFFGCVAAFGLTFISTALISQQFWLRLLGGLFLCYLGARTIISKPSQETNQSEGQGMHRAFASTFLLTLTNPMTILSFTAIFAALGLGSASANYFSATLIVVGVFLGSALWWLLLSGGVSLLRSKITHTIFLWVNRGSGMIILLFGILALISTL